jgi:hypothetical protein
MFDDSERFRLFGTTSREEEPRRLVAGSLDVILQGGNLRRLRYLGHEVLRGVAFLVRDRDWGTCAAEISDLTIEESPDRFAVRYRACCRAPSGAQLRTENRITGLAAGSLEFVALYSADADFETARAGFTVLHPLAGVVGQPVEVLHGDGKVENGSWPDLIAPWQPFKDIRAIAHRVAPGIQARTHLLGDTFEMEDQRNWTDASFKTYNRPLALPWPYTIPADTPQEQSVRVALACDAAAAAARPRPRVMTLDREETEVPLPMIGVGLRPECAATDKAALRTLRAVNAQLLLGHFDPCAGHGEQALAGYADLQRASGLPLTLEAALPCRRPLLEEAQEIADQRRRVGLALESIFVCPSVDRQSTPPGSRWPECPPLEDVYSAMRAALGPLRLGGGMMSYFTELNRKRAPADRIDYLSHATNPIVHAASDLNVMQSFEALADVVRSVRAIYPDKPYRIGPSTIAMRQNPYGAATKDNPTRVRIPMANVDPRHNGDFAAAWTLAYAATVSGARLEALTLSTLTGPFGLIAGRGEPAAEGELRPLARVIAELGKMAGKRLWRLRSSHPGTLAGLGAPGIMLLANLTPETLEVCPEWSFSTARSLVRPRRIAAAGRAIELPPYESVAVE